MLCWGGVWERCRIKSEVGERLRGRQGNCLVFLLKFKGKDCEMNITHVDMVGKYFTEEKTRKTVRLYMELHNCSYIGKAGNPSSTNWQMSLLEFVTQVWWFDSSLLSRNYSRWFWVWEMVEFQLWLRETNLVICRTIWKKPELWKLLKR